VIQDPLAHFLALAAVVHLALYLEARSHVCKSLGAGLVAILLGMVLSNSGVIPGESYAYEFLRGSGVGAGVVLILMSVDVRSVRQAGPRMLAAFGLGALGTVVGAITAATLLGGRIGPETWKLTGQYTGTYIGGGMNFAALGQAFHTSGDLFSAAIAADVVVTAIWMMACLAAPVLLGRGGGARVAPLRSPKRPTQEKYAVGLDLLLYESGKSLLLSETAALVAIAVGALWLSDRLAALFPPFPAVLWLTTLALAAAQVPALKRLPGGAMIGNYLLLLFLASNGAQSVIANIVRVGPNVFYFASLTVAVHGLIQFGVGRLLRFDAGTLAVASQANVGGSASAMAMASARGYLDRLLPGVAVSLLGYAIGNYAGFAVAALVRNWLGPA
jgi:uncharacterized membrane protein